MKPAVRKQFVNYYTKPNNYGFKREPTIEEAIRKFDQTGAEGKLKFLQKNNIDITQPLRSVFEQDLLEKEIKRQIGYGKDNR